jgi:hypothetical protein
VLPESMSKATAQPQLEGHGPAGFGMTTIRRVAGNPDRLQPTAEQPVVQALITQLIDGIWPATAGCLAGRNDCEAGGPWRTLAVNPKQSPEVFRGKFVISAH